MARKLYSLKSELLAIKTICECGNDRSGQYLLGKLNDNYFATEIAKVSWKRILRVLRKTGDIPNWHDLITDPGIDDTIRDALEEVDFAPVTDKKSTTRLIDRLNDYRKNRMLLDIGKLLDSKLNSTDAFDSDDVIKSIQDKLSGSTNDNNFKVLRIGKNSNVQKHLKRVLTGIAVSYIPTGFAAFDEKNRGLIRGAAVIIAGETGGGKSALLGTLARNMALSGADIAFLPLEMTNDEVLQRDVARNTDASLNELIDPKVRLTKKQRKDAYRRYLRYNERIAKHGGNISYWEPQNDISIENLFATIQPYEYDVVIVDYLGLLDGMSGDDQWRSMMNALRYGKIWAKNHNCTVIFAAQLSQDGLLKYSKGMADHANNMWTWRKDDLFKTTGVALIKQPKARQQADHDFMLKFDLANMDVRDVDEDDIAAFEAGSKKRKEGSKKRWEKEGEEDDWNSSNDSELPKQREKKRSGEKRSDKPYSHATSGAKKVIEI